MRMVRFLKEGRPCLAVQRNGDWIDLGLAAPWVRNDLPALLAGGDDALETVGRALAKASAKALLSLEGLHHLPPVTPTKILCVGLNYRSHAAETALPAGDFPNVFVRFPDTLTGHRQALRLPANSTQMDYEGELAAVIGRAAWRLSAEQALDAVAAYTIFNDASVRDYQFRGSQWTLGKNFPATGGCGPWLVTADELPPGAHGLRLETRVNGELLQSASTADMIFSVADLVASLSHCTPLAPGDLIVTGTPAGVGFTRQPPRFLQSGDLCAVEIEGLGTLENPIQESNFDRRAPTGSS